MQRPVRMDARERRNKEGAGLDGGSGGGSDSCERPRWSPGNNGEVRG